jgi:hypothetical protein
MTRDVFFRFYANLPPTVRKEVILVLEEAGGPITWEVAYREIEADTELGKTILGKLAELGFIPTDPEPSNIQKNA